jgi:hypothetical protein
MGLLSSHADVRTQWDASPRRNASLLSGARVWAVEESNVKAAKPVTLTLTLLAAALAFPWAARAEQTSVGALILDTPATHEFRQDAFALQAFDKPSDADALAAESLKLMAKWSERDPVMFAQLMINAAQALQHLGTSTASTETIRRLADGGLLKSQGLPLSQEGELALLAAQSSFKLASPLSAANAASEQAARVRSFLAVWQKVRAGIDPNFDFKDMASISVVPPPVTLPDGTRITYNGMPIDVSEDPAWRADYQAIIDANERKKDVSSQQGMLRQLDDAFAALATFYLVGPFLGSTSRLEDLQPFLNRAGLDEGQKALILALANKRANKLKAQAAASAPHPGKELAWLGAVTPARADTVAASPFQ